MILISMSTDGMEIEFTTMERSFSKTRVQDYITDKDQSLETFPFGDKRCDVNPLLIEDKNYEYIVVVDGGIR